MPLIFKLTREDMLRSKVLDPGWYRVKIKKVYQKIANDNESMNTWVELVVVAGPAQRDGSKVVDTPLKRCFSEKAPGFIVPFLQALGVTVTENGGDFDIEKTVGRELLAYN